MSGDPTIEVSIEIALKLQEAGVDAIEWGVPFSDPLADGPVIQNAGERARKAGNTIIKAIDAVKEARRRGLTIPVVLFTYMNPVLYFGEQKIINKLKEAEVDGLLIPDLPIEESQHIRTLCKRNGISFITLVTLSSATRIEKICRHSEGFVYFVSSLGVTGTRDHFSDEIKESIQFAKKYTDAPILVGFGISKREHVIYFNQISDGVIVGSAIVKKIEEHRDELINDMEKERALLKIKQFVEHLRST